MMNPIVRDDCLSILSHLPLDQFRDRSILLTGANGLFGSYLVQLFVLCNTELGVPVNLHCVSRHGPKKELEPFVDNKKVHWHALDLTAGFSFNQPVDYVLHAACYGQPKLWMEDKLKTIDLNVAATRNLLRLAKDREARFLFFSSQDVYGDIPVNQPATELFNGNISPTGPRSAYGESKRLGETICSIFAEQGQYVRIARIGHTYGPGVSINDGRVLGDFIRMAIIDKKIVARDPGLSVKTFGYVADILEMLLLIAASSKELVYNVGGRDQVSIKQLAEAVAAICDNAQTSFPTAHEKCGHIGTDSPYSGLDIRRFESEFGVRSFVPFTEGLRRTINWNKQLFF
jgi:dTDP-glucose 4,6-dehydratase/UDP-glucuronate decarboxylase